MKNRHRVGFGGGSATRLWPAVATNDKGCGGMAMGLPMPARSSQLRPRSCRDVRNGVIYGGGVHNLFKVKKYK